MAKLTNQDDVKNELVKFLNGLHKMSEKFGVLIKENELPTDPKKLAKILQLQNDMFQLQTEEMARVSNLVVNFPSEISKEKVAEKTTGVNHEPAIFGMELHDKITALSKKLDDLEMRLSKPVVMPVAQVVDDKALEVKVDVVATKETAPHVDKNAPAKGEPAKSEAIEAKVNAATEAAAANPSAQAERMARRRKIWAARKAKKAALKAKQELNRASAAKVDTKTAPQENLEAVEKPVDKKSIVEKVASKNNIKNNDKSSVLELGQPVKKSSSDVLQLGEPVRKGSLGVLELGKPLN